jgi:hypothetical protein
LTYTKTKIFHSIKCKYKKGGMFMNPGCGCGSGNGIGGAAFALVLFILLVIILGAFI